MWKHRAIVKQPVLQVKEYPSAQSQTTDELLYGMEVLVWERPVKGWASIETFYGYRGCVETEGLESRERNVGKWQRAERLVVEAPSADLFEIPGYRNPYFLCLPRGSQVAVSEYEGQAGWRQVRLVDGRNAYVRKSAVRPVRSTYYSMEKEEDKLRESLVRTALSYLHTPYRWGGKTAWGIDCSGLCSMVYLLHGIHIWRDAKLKIGYPVKEIPVCAVKPGDLLYFPGHMALYIGGLQYVHATGRMGEDGVVVSSLNHTAENYREDLATTITAAGTVF